MPAPSLQHCYNYSYSCGRNSLWNHYSQEAEKSKKSKIYHLAVVRRTQQAACWAHPGSQLETRDQGQIYIPLSPTVHSDETMLFATRKESCWPSGQFTVSWPTEEGLLPGERWRRQRRGGPWPMGSSRSMPVLCQTSHVCGRGPVTPYLTEDNPEAERGSSGTSCSDKNPIRTSLNKKEKILT